MANSMKTENTRQKNLKLWLNWQQEQRKQRLDKRFGVPINKTVGSSILGGSVTTPDNTPSGENVTTSEEDRESLKVPLGVGDKTDKFKLYDCETGEPVTLDGIGGKDVEPAYPAGFEDCVPPTVDSGYVEGVYWTVSTEVGKLGQGYTPVLVNFAAQTWQKAVDAGLASIPFVPESLTNQIEFNNGNTFSGIHSVCPQTGCDSVSFGISRRFCSTRPNPICDLPPPIAVWPESDRNHLNYNTEKGCIEPLCPELNPRVSAKYKSCQDEMILCDEDGNKNKIKINNDGTMDVYQKDFGQMATIKNGKVTSVRKMTESQMDREFI